MEVASEKPSEEPGDRREISRLRRPTSRRSEREEEPSACSARNDSVRFGGEGGCGGACSCDEACDCGGACGCGIELLGAAGIGAGDLGAIDQCVECGFAGAQVGVPDDGRRKI